MGDIGVFSPRMSSTAAVVKSADVLSRTSLILDMNRASEEVGRSIGEIRQVSAGLKAVFWE